MTLTRRAALTGLMASSVAACTSGTTITTGPGIDANVEQAIANMYARLPYTRELAQRAEGMLIMPGIIKGGLIVGGAYGEGALRLPTDNYAVSAQYYSFGSGSVGYQVGAQKTAHALFFMTPAALVKFRNSNGWEVGADAEVTLLDTGVKADLNSTSLQKPVLAVVFSQQGLLAGASLKGAKYSRIKR